MGERRYTSFRQARGLALLAALVCVTLALAIPGGKGSAATSASAPNARSSDSGTVVNIGDVLFPSSLNPLQAGLSVDRALLPLLWAPLVQFDDQSRPFGILAAAAPTPQNGGVSADGKTITIHLKPNLHWSDGQPLTSADVAFGWQVESDPATGPACIATLCVIASVDTPDATTAVIHLKQARGDYLADLPDVFPQHAFPSVHQAALTLAEDASYNCMSKPCVTSGPYQISSVTSTTITFSANPQYSATPGPYVSTIVFTTYPSQQALVSAQLAGSVDISGAYSTASVAALQAGSGVRVVLTPSNIYEQLLYNVSPTYNGAPNPMADVNVRKAINMAIDRDQICQAVLLLPAASCSLARQEGPIPPAPASAVVVAPTGLGFSVDKARALLASSSFAGKPITLDLVTTTHPATRATEATAIVQDLQAIGITVNVKYINAGTLFGEYSSNGTLATGAYQIAIYAGGGGGPYPDSLVYNYGSKYIPSSTNLSAIDGNWGRVNDPQIDQDLDAAAATVDPQQRQSFFADFAQRVVDQAYMLTLYNHVGVIAFNPSKVGNIRPLAANPYWNAFEWFVPGANATPPPTLDTGKDVATPTPTPTPMPTATPTEVTPEFSILGVHIGLKTADLKKASLKRATVGEHLKLSVHAGYTQLPDGAQATVEWLVKLGGKKVFDKRATKSLNGSDAGATWYTTSFTPKKPGKYSFTGRVTIGSTAQKKTARFAAVR